MGAKKSKRPDTRGGGAGPRGRKSSMVLVVIIAVGIAVAGMWLFFDKDATEADGKTATSAAGTAGSSSDTATLPNSFDRIVGRWLRPDGGYILEIQSADTSGKLKAAYFNPRPINVSQARATQKDDKTRIFIELRDTGYPGATYNLIYNPQQDMMAGVYFQPTVNQNFDVIFVRQQ